MVVVKLVFWLHCTILSVKDGFLERGNVLSDGLGIVDLESEGLVFVVTGIPTWGTGSGPNALDQVERLMPNVGDAALIAL